LDCIDMHAGDASAWLPAFTRMLSDSAIINTCWQQWRDENQRHQMGVKQRGSHFKYS